MNISSDKLTCYIEGVNFPIKSIDVNFTANSISRSKIVIPLGSIIYPKMWANALIQVCYIDFDVNGKKKEKLLFQGLVFSLSINELMGELEITAESVWSCLNLNSTLDYTAPKRYGIKYLNEDLTIYIGNETKIQTINDVEADQYSLSSRYFFLGENKDDISIDSPDSFKLQFIIDRNPLAEKFAFSFFEDISYKNFYLTRSYLERFNLLNKVSTKSERTTLLQEAEQNTIESSAYFLELDTTRSNLYKYFASFRKTTTPTGTTIQVNGKPFQTGKTSYTFGELYSLALNVGWTGQDATIAAAIAMAESGGDPNALNTKNADGSVDSGLWQINSIHKNEFDVKQIFDPVYNAQFAFKLYSRRKSFNDWVTYNNGAYKAYLPK